MPEYDHNQAEEIARELEDLTISRKQEEQLRIRTANYIRASSVFFQRAYQSGHSALANQIHADMSIILNSAEKRFTE